MIKNDLPFMLGKTTVLIFTFQLQVKAKLHMHGICLVLRRVTGETC